jgi:hypothetical protein
VLRCCKPHAQGLREGVGRGPGEGASGEKKEKGCIWECKWVVAYRVGLGRLCMCMRGERRGAGTLGFGELETSKPRRSRIWCSCVSRFDARYWFRLPNGFVPPRNPGRLIPLHRSYFTSLLSLTYTID